MNEWQKLRLCGLEPNKPYSETARWFITRNGDYVQKVGDILTKAVRFKKRQYPEDFDKPPEIVEEKETSIKIVAIQAYGKDLKDIGEGTTCAIALEGDTDFLSQDWNFI